MCKARLFTGHVFVVAIVLSTCQAIVFSIYAVTGVWRFARNPSSRTSPKMTGRKKTVDGEDEAVGPGGEAAEVILRGLR